MSWHRYARTGLLVAGAVCVVALFVLIRSRPDAPAPVSLEPVDREALEEGGATTSSRLSGAFESVRISASSWKRYEDSIFYTDVHLDFGEDGVQIWADEVLARGAGVDSAAPDRLEMNGNVRLEAEDGMTLETPSADYEGAAGVVTMPGAVTLVKGRMTSTGVGGYYDRTQGLFRIQDQAHLVVAASADDSSTIDATATMMTMAREEHFVRLEGNARIVRQAETASADLATIYFVEGTEDTRLLDLRGRASVVPTEGAAEPPPEMHGDAIAMTFRPEDRTLQQATMTSNASLALRDDAGTRTITAGWIDVLTAADGRTIASLTGRQGVVVRLPAADGTAARTIRAATLSSTGAGGRGLESARFDGGVTFVEHTAGPDSPAARTGESRELTLQLDGGFESVRQAEFTDDVTFTAGETRATSARAVYDAAADRLQLFPAPGAQGSRTAALPRAETARMTIDARDIALSLAGDDVQASGDVRTLMQPDPDATDRPSALFSPDSAVLGSAAAFEYEDETGFAVYQGTDDAPALLIQDGNEISGGLIRLSQESGDLSASGGVESVFVLEDDAGGPPETYRVQAESLEYVEASRRATYTGSPVRLLSGDAETEALSVVLTVSDAGRDVERIEWTGAVYALLEKQYEAAGSRLTHDVGSGQYRLEGTPAVTKLPTQEGECARERGSVTLFNRRTNEKAWPPDLNQRGKVESVTWPCGKTIR